MLDYQPLNVVLEATCSHQKNNVEHCQTEWQKYSPAHVLFILPESDDRVDPNYDFVSDSYCKTRDKGTDHDVYAHELFATPNCDGLLVTRSMINADRAQAIRNVGGIHQFLRFPSGSPIVADCGAFQYRNDEAPPYTCEETCEFYESLGFDYGISLDHMILDFDPEYDLSGALLTKLPSEDARRRFRLTLDNAIEMLRLSKKNQYSFKLMGGVQGWSPDSYRAAVEELIEAGFDYIALGGLARASDSDLRLVLSAVREPVLAANAKLHVLGVARLSLMEDYMATNVASCDSASTILQAFKSNKDNYHTRKKKYTAVRIPPASGDLSPKVRKLLKKEVAENGESAAGKLHKKLIQLEQQALKDLRAYDAKQLPLEKTMESLIAYEDQFGDEKRYYPLFEETLRDRPWETCPCAICRAIGIEVIILRGNNRNRRRGFHNTYVFFEQFKEKREALSAQS